jgi:hypothetical protein
VRCDGIAIGQRALHLFVTRASVNHGGDDVHVFPYKEVVEPDAYGIQQ